MYGKDTAIYLINKDYGAYFLFKKQVDDVALWVDLKYDRQT